MLKAMLALWDKKGERYSFVNVSQRVQLILRSVLPSSTVISSTYVSPADEKLSMATNQPISFDEAISSHPFTAGTKAGEQLSNDDIVVVKTD